MAISNEIYIGRNGHEQKRVKVSRNRVRLLPHIPGEPVQPVQEETSLDPQQILKQVRYLSRLRVSFKKGR